MWSCIHNFIVITILSPPIALLDRDLFLIYLQLQLFYTEFSNSGPIGWQSFGIPLPVHQVSQLVRNQCTWVNSSSVVDMT